ncbi:MAG: hypothetical protein EOO41_02220, partial [Methanobacteriota archaeon]
MHAAPHVNSTQHLPPMTQVMNAAVAPSLTSLRPCNEVPGELVGQKAAYSRQTSTVDLDVAPLPVGYSAHTAAPMSEVPTQATASKPAATALDAVHAAAQAAASPPAGAASRLQRFVRSHKAPSTYEKSSVLVNKSGAGDGRGSPSRAALFAPSLAPEPQHSAATLSAGSAPTAIGGVQQQAGPSGYAVQVHVLGGQSSSSPPPAQQQPLGNTPVDARMRGAGNEVLVATGPVVPTLAPPSRSTSPRPMNYETAALQARARVIGAAPKRLVMTSPARSSRAPSPTSGGYLADTFTAVRASPMLTTRHHTAPTTWLLSKSPRESDVDRTSSPHQRARSPYHPAASSQRTLENAADAVTQQAVRALVTQALSTAFAEVYSPKQMPYEAARLGAPYGAQISAHGATHASQHARPAEYTIQYQWPHAMPAPALPVATPHAHTSVPWVVPQAHTHPLAAEPLPPPDNTAAGRTRLSPAAPGQYTADVYLQSSAPRIGGRSDAESHVTPVSPRSHARLAPSTPPYSLLTAAASSFGMLPHDVMQATMEELRVTDSAAGRSSGRSSEQQQHGKGKRREQLDNELQMLDAALAKESQTLLSTFQLRSVPDAAKASQPALTHAGVQPSSMPQLW